MAARRLTLLSRAYCHLCDDMRDALVPIVAAAGVTVVELDVDADPALEARYGELVPVLLQGDVEGGVELCHYALDAARVRAAINEGQTLVSGAAGNDEESGSASRQRGSDPH
jgi:hypothetical protein